MADKSRGQVYLGSHFEGTDAGKEVMVEALGSWTLCICRQEAEGGEDFLRLFSFLYSPLDSGQWCHPHVE